MKLLGSFRLWLVALVLVTVSVLALPSSPRTTQARINYLETLVKCPSCDNISVAQSTTASSLAVRAEIVSLVHKGVSDAAVLSTIEQSYGPQVLLSPPNGGVTDLLWIGPLALLLVAGLIVARVRRR
jgi:cytochrome c-type biogenesis protein CcmH